MSKSKLTLLVDGNWLLMSRMSAISKNYDDPQTFCKELKILMIKSINLVLRTFPQIDNIIFVADGGSWRNSIELPKFLTEEYKGNREKSEEIDWELVFAAYEDFIAKLRNCGITVSKELGIEGDDWVWFWSTKLNNEGTNVIIWSKDKDLTQLVKTNKNKCFTICWNKESGIIAQDVQDDDMDFLFNFEYSKNDDIIKSIISKSKGITYINPNEVVIDKIVRGDKGDNIFPIIEKKSNTNPDKTFRIYKKDLDFTIDIHDDQSIKNYIDRILSSKSYAGKVNKSEEDIIEHFKYNAKLVELNEINYPQDILDIFSKYDDYNCCKDTSYAESIIIAESNQITSILDTI